MQKLKTLKLNKDFVRLYNRGKSSVHPLLVTYAAKSGGKNRHSGCRMGITVTKKLGTAVSRNRCKRIIREAYRQLEPTLPDGWDFVFVARVRTKDAKSTQILPVMKKQIQSLTAQKQTGSPKPARPRPTKEPGAGKPS